MVVGKQPYIFNFSTIIAIPLTDERMNHEFYVSLQ